MIRLLGMRLVDRPIPLGSRIRSGHRRLCRPKECVPALQTFQDYPGQEISHVFEQIDNNAHTTHVLTQRFSFNMVLNRGAVGTVIVAFDA